MPFPDIDPVLFQIGPIAIRWYALAYVAGLFLGWCYMLQLANTPALWGGKAKDGAPVGPAHVDDFFFWATIGVIAGGRLGYVLFYQPAMIWTNPLEIFQPWNGGMSFHGGLIGVTLAIVLYTRSAKIPMLRLGDAVAAATPIGLFFGRIANFINGELYGRTTELPWGVIFPTGGSLPRHPSQLYEAALEGLVLFAVLAFATWRFKSLTRPGLNIGIFLAGYGIFRASLETVRQPDTHMPDFPFGLTMGMMLSLPMLAAGLWLVWRAVRAKPA